MRIFIIPILLFSFLISDAHAKENISQHDYTVLEKSYQLLQAEKYTKSLDLLRPLLEKKKPASYAFSYAAICYNSLDKLNLAIKTLQKAVLIYPKNANFWYNLGISQLQNDDCKNAIMALNNAEKYFEKKNLPKTIPYHIAFAHYKLEQYSLAEKKISEANKIKSPPKYWLELEVYCQIALEKWKKAKRTTKRILKLNMNDARTWELLGQISLNQKEYLTSSSYLEIAQIISSKFSEASILSNLYQNKSAWNEQLRNDNDSAYNKAKIYFKSNRYEDAEKAISKPVQDMETAYLLASVLFANGKSKQAVTELQNIDKLPILYLENLGSKKLTDKKKRQIKNQLKAKAYLLTGQILWLEHDWLAARNSFKKLELHSGYEEIGKSLARCMQSLITEQNKEISLPSLNDPPMIIEN